MSLFASLFGMAGAGGRGPLDPFWYHEVGAVTTSGERVGPEVAETVSCIYRGKQIIAEGVAKFPCKVFRRLEDGGKEEAPEHPVAALFRVGPNETDSPSDFIDEMTGTAVLRGKAYAEMVAGDGGFASSLVPLEFDRVREERVAGPGKRLRFWVKDAKGNERPLGSDKVFRLCGPNRGRSLLDRMRETAGMARAAEGFGAAQFGRAPMMAGFLAPKQGVTMNAEALKAAAAAFRESNSGRAGWGRVAVLPGLEYHQMGMTLRDAQFLELRKFTREEIATFMGVPPHKLGVMDKAGYASVEAQNRALFDDCLMPWFVRWEQAIAGQLLRPISEARKGDAGEFFVRFNADALLRGTTADRAAAEAVWVQNGILTRNEVRAIEDRNPLPGLDEPLTPVSNAQSQSTAPRVPAAAPAEDPEAEPEE